MMKGDGKEIIVMVLFFLSLLLWWFPTSEGCYAEDGKNHTEFHLNIHQVSHYSFFPGSPRWPTPPKFTLTYSFPQGFPSNFISSIVQAFNEWDSKTPFNFRQVANNSPSDLKVSFQRGSHGDGVSFDGTGGVLAHAFAPQNGWLHFDADDRYSITPTTGFFHLKSVAVHEIGHLLGLDHSNVQQAIMYPFISSGTDKSILHPDDLNGLRALYGY